MTGIIHGPNKDKILGYLHQGDAFLMERLNEQAIACYQAALTIEPGIGEAQYRIALALTRLGKNCDAINVLKQSTKIYRNANSFNLLGKNLLLVGEIDAAQQAFRKAVKIDKKDVSAVAGMADVICHKGFYKDAYKIIQPYIRKGIINTELANIATTLSKKTGSHDEVLTYLHKIKNDENLHDDVLMIDVLYMIADINDNIKNYNQAIKYYILANERRAVNYDHEFTVNLLSSIQSMYTKENFSSMNISTNTSSKPVFIVGMPRSGTTLIEQILASHSKVYGAGELPYISDFVAERFSQKGGIYPSCLSDIDQSELDKFAGIYLDKLKDNSGSASRIVDKMPHNYVYLGFINQLFPNARIIYCRRNPVDTCLSIFFTRFNDTHPYATSFKSLAQQYRYSVDLMNYWKHTLSLPILEVEYENIILNHEDSVTSIVDFCGLEMEQQCLSFHKNDRFVATASKDQVNKPIYTTSMERWKNYLPDIQPLVDELKALGLFDEN